MKNDKPWRPYCNCGNNSVSCPGGIETIHCDYCSKPTWAIWRIRPVKENVRDILQQAHYGIPSIEADKIVTRQEFVDSVMEAFDEVIKQIKEA